MTERQLVVHLRKQIVAAGSLRAWCRANGGVSPATVSRVVNGRIPCPPVVYGVLSLRRVVTFHPTTRAKP